MDVGEQGTPGRGHRKLNTRLLDMNKRTDDIDACDKLMLYLPLHWCPGGQSADKLAGTMQPDGALLIGLVPEGSELKRSPEMELSGRDVGALAVEIDTLPMAGRDLAHPCRASTPGEAAPACPTAKLPGKNPNACYIPSRKPDVLPGAKHLGKSEKAQVSQVAPRTEPSISLMVASDRPSGLDLTPLPRTCNDTLRSTQVSWGWEGAAR